MFKVILGIVIGIGILTIPACSTREFAMGDTVRVSHAFYRDCTGVVANYSIVDDLYYVIVTCIGPSGNILDLEVVSKPGLLRRLDSGENAYSE